MAAPSTRTVSYPVDLPDADHMRFHRPHEHLATTFGNDTFALKAEAFARFFGTPVDADCLIFEQYRKTSTFQ